METAIANSETLASALAIRIKTYKKEHPSLSGAQMARRFGMPASSLNRIENEEVRVPTIDQVLKILRGTGATGDILKYLEANYPSIAETYREVYDTRNTNFVPQGLEEQLNDKDKFLIVLLAITGDGTTRDEISKEFGKKGLTGLDSLLEKGHLVEEDGVIGKNDKDLTASSETLKNVLCYTVEECFKPASMVQKVNYLNYKVVGVKNETVAKRVRVILDQARSEIEKILDDSENLGSERIFYGLVTDTLLSNRADEQGVLQ